MNLLVDELPEAVEIDGQEYEINTDFKACLRIILAFEDGDLTPSEKQLIMLANLYPVQPENTRAALEMGMKFMNGGEAADGESDGKPRLYSFDQDGNFIFAAFKQTHGIDLASEPLHWWKFLSLFMDLGSETTFCSLVGLRKRIKSGKASKEERKAYREMGEVAELKEPDMRTLEEREKAAEFFRLAEEGRKRRAAK
jgi:hypothetical protein